jgi:hypothetical protein
MVMHKLLEHLYGDLLDYPVIFWFGGSKWVFRKHPSYDIGISALQDEIRFLNKYYIGKRRA